MIDDILKKVINKADEDMMKEILEEVIEKAREDAKLNSIILELERGPPGMEERLEERLRTRRLEVMLAMKMLVLEEERMERLAEMTKKKELWIDNGE